MMRVFLIDDQIMFRQGLKALLGGPGTFIVSGESRAAELAVQRIEECGADIVVLDSGLGEVTISRSVTVLKETFPEIPILVVSRHIDPFTVRETLAAGADGFLPKNADSTELFRALKLVGSGGCFVHNDIMSYVVDEFRSRRREPAPEHSLTSREDRVIRLVSEGKNNREIADELFVSISTVKNHLRGLFRKFRVSDRTKLVVEAMNRGILHSELPVSRANVS